jgi:hypothetical protein
MVQLAPGLMQLDLQLPMLMVSAGQVGRGWYCLWFIGLQGIVTDKSLAVNGAGAIGAVATQALKEGL